MIYLAIILIEVGGRIGGACGMEVGLSGNTFLYEMCTDSAQVCCVLIMLIIVTEFFVISFNNFFYELRTFSFFLSHVI